jgi:NADH-quinone oxidoreductase subunit C
MTPDELCAGVRDWLGHNAETEVEHGQLTVDVPPEAWVTTLRAVRDRLGCDFFDWLSAVDELADGFSVLTHLWSTAGRHHLLIRTRLPAGNPVLATATGIFRGANWHERETREMFGIVFDGHPNPIPLLLPDGFEGQPLRKDFVLVSRAVKAWPGEVEPGQSKAGTTRRRRRSVPPGVPDPGEWGPLAGKESAVAP